MSVEIKLGDEIQMELSPKGEPRWQYAFGSILIDKGYSGNFVYGLVDDVDNVKHVANISFVGNPENWWWQIPIKGHSAYAEDQWTRPGFPVPIKNKNIFQNKCTCGSHTTYGKNSNIHSDWCDAL